MSETTNLGGRPEIGGKIGPVSYGDDLLAAIDRTWPADGARSRSDWLRDTVAKALNARAPESITRADMVAAGIDIDRVERRQDPTTDVPTWQATDADSEWRIVFGVELDPNGEIPEGEHKGWAYAKYELVPNEDGDGFTEEEAGVYGYCEPYDLAGLLAEVAKVAPVAAD